MHPRIGISTSPILRRSVTIGLERPLDTIDHAYVDAVMFNDGLPVLLPLVRADLADGIVNRLDGLILSGGGDVDPRRYGARPVPEVTGVHEGRDELELALLTAARRRRLPVLAVCRGAQILNVGCGGTLIQHLDEHVSHQDAARWSSTAHQVDIVAGSLLHRIVGSDTVGVNTLHHQAVDRPGDGIRVVGTDDAGVIEAIEVDDHPEQLGVQWHPELLVDEPAHAALFAWVVGEARHYREAVGIGDGYRAATVA